MGDTLARGGSSQSAIPYLEKAVRFEPSLAPAPAALGRAYLRSGRSREAVPHLKAALPKDEKGATLYQRAQAYKQTGQTELANRALQEFNRTSSAGLERTQQMNEEREITPP